MPDSLSHSIRVIDSHTGGEPTRVVIEGGPALDEGNMAARLVRLREKHDDFRRAVVCQPRGGDAVVGALLCKPYSPGSVAGVIFFNNVGYLGMCVHGTMGVAATLAHVQRVAPGAVTFQLDTPVGPIRVTQHEDSRVTVRNVPSYRLRADVEVELAGHGPVTGDVAWGGNWFFLTSDHGQELHLENVEALTDFAWRLRQSLAAGGITGDAGQEIDHIELFAPPQLADSHSKNFVLCPGKAYDRSPCGTGTSAKVACLAADGKMQAGEIWRQESIVGSLFEASYEWEGETIVPSVTGRAFVTAEATLMFAPDDPYRAGIGP